MQTHKQPILLNGISSVKFNGQFRMGSISSSSNISTFSAHRSNGSFPSLQEPHWWNLHALCETGYIHSIKLSRELLKMHFDWSVFERSIKTANAKTECTKTNNFVSVVVIHHVQQWICFDYVFDETNISESKSASDQLKITYAWTLSRT